MYVPAEASRETLYVKSEATLVGQALQKCLWSFITSLVVLLPVTARQHHHIALQSVEVMVTITTW